MPATAQLKGHDMHNIVFLDRATIAPQIRVRRPSFEHAR